MRTSNVLSHFLVHVNSFLCVPAPSLFLVLAHRDSSVALPLSSCSCSPLLPPPTPLFLTFAYILIPECSPLQPLPVCPSPLPLSWPVSSTPFQSVLVLACCFLPWLVDTWDVLRQFHFHRLTSSNSKTHSVPVNIIICDHLSGFLLLHFKPTSRPSNKLTLIQQFIRMHETYLPS